MNRTCTAFERWLDEGRPAHHADAHAAHARTCAHCAALLELETMLAAPPVAAAPAHFTGAVMQRVHASAPAIAPAEAAPAPRAAGPRGVFALLLDPWTALVATAVALLVVGREALVQFGFALVRVSDRVSAPSAWPAVTVRWPALPQTVMPDLALPDLGAIGHATAALTSDPRWSASLLLAIAPVVLIVSWLLFRWAERMVASIGAYAGRAIAGLGAAAR